MTDHKELLAVALLILIEVLTSQVPSMCRLPAKTRGRCTLSTHRRKT